MQNKKLEVRLIGIPTELLDEAGIGEDSIIEMFASDGNIVIRKTEDTEEFICDLDCENCPFNFAECEDDCEDCPCRENCDDYIESEDN